MEQIKTMDRKVLKEKIDGGEDFVLLEVLGEESYKKGHLPGAVRFQDMSLASDVIPDKDAVVVAYCSSFTWHSSTRVVRELTANGYKNVYDYEGGKRDWTDHGLPTEEG